MFNPRAAKLMTPGETMAIEGAPGLRLEASKTTRTWTYRYRSPVDGKLRQIKLGEWPELSLATAMGQWEKARQQRGAGKDAAVESKLKRETDRVKTLAEKSSVDYTVSRLIDDYLRGHVEINRSPRNAKMITSMLLGKIAPIAALPAATLSRTQCFGLLDKHTHTPVQCNKLKQELGAAWDRALDAGRIPDTTPNHWRTLMRGKLPSLGMNRGGERQTAKRILNDTELVHVINWLPNFSDTVADVLTMYLWTGTRGGELVAMHADEVSDEEGELWWTLPKEKTKNRKRACAHDLRVPLIGRAEEIVRRRLAQYPGDYLFKSDEDHRIRVPHISQEAVGQAVRFVMPYTKTRPTYTRLRLPVSHWGPHDLRRTVRTKLSTLGCPRDVAESVIGHTLEGVEGVYNLYRYDAERLEWLTILAGNLESLLDGPGGASKKRGGPRTTPESRAPATRPAVRLVRAA